MVGLQRGTWSLDTGFCGHLKPSFSLKSMIISIFPKDSGLSAVSMMATSLPGNASHFWMVLTEVKAFHFLFPRAMLPSPIT